MPSEIDELVGLTESGWESELLDKGSGEKLVWAGRPEALGRLVRQAIPEGLIGLAFVVFTLFWSVSVIHGGHNNWDRGKVVGPFARHNILIATGACLWMLPPGMYILSAPLRAWWKGQSTRYLLTSRRALICEPRLRGGYAIRRYGAGELGLMNREEFRDGFGSLVFEMTRNRLNMNQRIGFLAVADVSDVEALVRRTLIGPAVGASAAQPGGMHRKSGASPAKSFPCSYELTPAGRMQNILTIVVSSIFLTLILTATLTFPVVFLCVRFPARIDPWGFSGLLPVWVALPLVGLIGARIISRGVRSLICAPVKITINDQREIELVSRVRTTVVPVQDVLAIHPAIAGGSVRLRHKGGVCALLNEFADFRGFLLTIKELNPSVRISGF